MRVRVVIEYDIPAIDVLSDEDVRAIEAAVGDGAPRVFEYQDDAVAFADSWTVEVLK